MTDAVFYQPASMMKAIAKSGPIVATISASMEVIEADGRPFIIVDEYRWDYDATHEVIDGEVVLNTTTEGDQPK